MLKWRKRAATCGACPSPMHNSNLPSPVTRRWRTLPLCLALLLALSGSWPFASGGPSSQTQPTPRAAGTATPGGTASNLTPLPRGSDALNIAGDTKDPPSLDPAMANDTYSQLIVRQLF